MRLLITADLHFGHARSEPLAVELIDRMNRTGGDVLLVVGDTGTADGDAIERGLERFRFSGPKLFVPGNHELWSRSDDTITLFERDLPARVRSVGWQWLQSDPFVSPGADVAIVGSVGWYDYSFAVPELGVDRRFYQAKVSPGAAARVEAHRSLIRGDEPPEALELVARWNDGRFVRLGMTDAEFLARLIEGFDRQLVSVSAVRRVVCAVHHVPFAELLPPRHGGQWDFARAYLGSAAIGRAIARHRNVSHVVCGHSHQPAEAQLGGIRAINVGSGYRQKRFLSLDL